MKYPILVTASKYNYQVTAAVATIAGYGESEEDASITVVVEPLGRGRSVGGFLKFSVSAKECADADADLSKCAVARPSADRLDVRLHRNGETAETATLAPGACQGLVRVQVAFAAAGAPLEFAAAYDFSGISEHHEPRARRFLYRLRLYDQRKVEKIVRLGIPTVEIHFLLARGAATGTGRRPVEIRSVTAVAFLRPDQTWMARSANFFPVGACSKTDKACRTPM